MGITQGDELETHHAIRNSAFEAELVQIKIGVKTEFVAKKNALFRDASPSPGTTILFSKPDA